MSAVTSTEKHRRLQPLIGFTLVLLISKCQV